MKRLIIYVFIVVAGLAVVSNESLFAMQQPTSSQQTTTACSTSTNSDFSTRSALPQSIVPNWETTGKAGSWGPAPQSLPYVPVPAGCDCTVWKTQRVLQAVDMYISMGLNYCHHHIPGWTPPDDEGMDNATFRIPGVTCTKNRTLNGKIVWQGVDCSDFTSWYYNYALGVATGYTPLQTAIDTQACEPNLTWPAPTDPDNTNCTIDGAPGVALNYNKENFDNITSKLQPGDLLYIMTGNGQDNISHVITWTGVTVGTGPGQLPETSLAPDAYSYVGEGQQLAGAWVIADSHYAGPAYRPFLGWYRANLSHVRRIINQNNVSTADIIDPSTSTDFVYTPKTSKNASSCMRKSFTQTVTTDYDLAVVAINAFYTKYPTYFGTKSGGVTAGTTANGTFYIQYFANGTGIVAWTDGYLYWSNGSIWYSPEPEKTWKVAG
ncbi:MAG: hypothetical protein HQL01_14665 [Nitrospirae bacterium]|nr:hypothetical protein [Nitrospirota bacterium]